MKARIFLIVAFSLLSHLATFASSITYSFTGGRFADNLLSYCHARWLARVHGLDFRYRSFRYSDELMMDTMHQLKYEGHKMSEKRIKDAKVLEQLISDEEHDSLYVVSYHTKNIHIDWNDQDFITLLRNEVKPLQPLTMVAIPEGHKAIALHIRRGGGWDRPLTQNDTIVTAQNNNVKGYKQPFADKAYPKRFVPDSYYIDCLKYVLTQYPDELLYVHLFTDDPQPELIAEKYQSALNSSRIIFGYRKEDNRHDSNVLEDFFAMGKFDCLIRPQSGFSKLAGILERTPFEIFPKKHRWDDALLVIPRIGMLKRENGKYSESFKDIN